MKWNRIALVEYDAKTIALVVASIVVLFIAVMIREHINTKKGETGEDLAKVREVLKRLLPDYASYTTAYALYKNKTYRGRSTTTTYAHYAIAFKPGALAGERRVADEGQPEPGRQRRYGHGAVRSGRQRAVPVRCDGGLHQAG